MSMTTAKVTGSNKQASAKGQSLVEYGLFLGWGVVVGMGGLQMLGSSVDSSITEMKAEVQEPPTSGAIAHVEVDEIDADAYNSGVFINAGALNSVTGEQNGDPDDGCNLVTGEGC
jgi:hypothetical protein